VLIVFYVAFLHYRRALRPARDSLSRFTQAAEYPELSAETFRALGWYQRDRRNDWSPAKRPGVVRLGAIGDSFTFGDEVARGRDFPTQLERLLRARGFGNVEVGNFGVSGYGFAQAFELWQEHAQKYDLDAVLLGPACFQTERDSTFHPGGDTSPLIHGRFVLADDDVRFAAPAGKDALDVFNRYTAFIQPWRYLRYDRDTPMFLRGLVLPGRSVANPLYYDSRDAATETREIYRRLLRHLDRAAKAVVMLHFDPRIVELGKAAGTKTFAEEFLADGWRTFPHWRVAHASANGNLLVAKSFADVLSGAPQIELPIIRVETTRPPLQDAPPRTLEDVSSARILFDDSPIGRFMYLAPHNTPDEVVDFKQAGLRSLVAFEKGTVAGWGDQRQGLLDSVFVALTQPISEDAPVELEVDGGKRVLLDRVRLRAPGVAIGSVAAEWTEEERSSPPQVIAKRALARIAKVDVARLAGARILVGGNAVYQLDRAHADGWYLKPLVRQVYPRPGPDEFFDPLTARQEGAVFLLLERGDGAAPVPIGRWRIETQVAPYPDASSLRGVLNAR
jgi:hypothetical protein